MIKLVTVVGARPQFIKAAMLSRAVCGTDGVEEVVIHTGQHYDPNMSDVFFDELKIERPTHNLGIGGGSHGQNTGRMLEAIEHILLKESPTAVVVYGDTDSTLAGALAAAKLCIPVVHVEAGLRSYNMSMPEEVNRRLTDHVSSLLLAPNESAVTILLGEGLNLSTIRNTGDLMFDAALHFGELAQSRSDVLISLGLRPGNYILATVHRQENTDDRNRLACLVRAFENSPFTIVLPLHPRARKRMEEFSIVLPSNVLVTQPLGYLDMVMLEKNARLIATDSGGVQKEAYFHGIPCITLRNETEWPELIEMGWNRLVSPDSEDLTRALMRDYERGRQDLAPYGNGDAADLAIAAIKAAFANKS
jgi:UDP-GlcNAc3NAcA epimerase